MIWLSVDPGEDTGWALWDDDKLLDAGDDKGWQFLDRLWDSCGPCVSNGRVPEMPWTQIRKLVVEDWALYPWKTKELAWDKCRTARFIGAIELLTRQANLEVQFQPAKIKEAAKQGGAMELFLRPLHDNRHANDAIMHGYFHLQRSKAALLNKSAEERA